MSEKQQELIEDDVFCTKCTDDDPYVCFAERFNIGMWRGIVDEVEDAGGPCNCGCHEF